MNYMDYYESPLGTITISSDGDALTGLWFNGQKYDREGVDIKMTSEEPVPVLQETKRWLDLYFAGKDPGFTPKLNPPGSEFRRLVADIMLTIPFGSTMTYGEIAAEAARRMGRSRMSAQAVGGAVGHNAISIIIPCHRVVGTNGSLTGYAGGVEKKIRLLENEGISLKEKGLYRPKKGTAL